jgi:hypothetical protein
MSVKAFEKGERFKTTLIGSGTYLKNDKKVKDKVTFNIFDAVGVRGQIVQFNGNVLYRYLVTGGTPINEVFDFHLKHVEKLSKEGKVVENGSKLPGLRK